MGDVWFGYVDGQNLIISEMISLSTAVELINGL